MADILSTIAKEKQTIKVRLADTNNIGAMLTLGEKSACCRALGSLHEEAGISLITNKMLTAFEILADEKTIGSVMVYLASVNGDLALILGTLETKSLYSENAVVSAAVVNFAKQFSSLIGKPHIPIYMATAGQDKTIESFANPSDMPPAAARFFNNLRDSKTYNIKILGKVGQNPVYLSYDLSSKTKWDNLETKDYLYHLNDPFEEREKVSLTLPNKTFSLIKDYFKSAITPHVGIVPGPLAFILSEIEKMKTSSKIWTQTTAEIYLKEHNFSKTDAYYVIQHCYWREKFNSDLFNLFVKGYEIKRDPNFSMVAFNYSLRDDDVFDYQRYATIYSIAKKVPQMTYEEISSYGYAPTKELEALFYVADKFPNVNPFEVMNLASKYSFFRANSLNFDSYNKIVNFLEQGISIEVINRIFAIYSKDGIFDSKGFTEIERIADAAIVRKDIFLSAKNNKFTDTDIKNFIYMLSPKIHSALKICDENTLIAAMGYKMAKFEDFVNAASDLAFNLNSAKKTEDFLEAFYPSKSKKARILQDKITKLKSNFQNTPKVKLLNLKNEINTATKKLRDLLVQEKNLSPQEKIERIGIMGNFEDPAELKQLIKLAQTPSAEKDSPWNKKVLELISNYLGGAYTQKIEDKLHLISNPYLEKLFKSIQGEEFKSRFSELLVLLTREDFGNSLDKLHHNIATKKEFESLKLNYEKYTNPKKFPSRTFYDGNNFVEIRQVNMRDVEKSLFLGNNANACTAMGSFYDKYAIPYIMNTLVGAIEVIVNGKPVGNSMIYPIISVNSARFAVDYDQEIALLIDDLKIVAPYNKFVYLQEVARLAEDIAKDIGIQNGRVYISDSNTVGYNKFDKGSVYKFYLIGKTLDPIWLNATYTDAKGGSAGYVGTFVSTDKIK